MLVGRRASESESRMCSPRAGDQSLADGEMYSTIGARPCAASIPRSRFGP